jgi:ribose transport system substrate-binding protein
MKTTIKDIARQAGVSIATVSHVINATRYVSPELVEKIREIIQANDYKKKIEYNFQAGKRSQIAFLVPCFEDYMELALVLSRKFLEAGFTISVLATNDDMITEKNILTAMFGNRSVGGIILIPSAPNSYFYKNIPNHNVPFVLVERYFNDADINSVITDHEEASQKSTNYLIQCGHNKIGIITEKKEFSTSREQLSGYQKALAAHNIPFRPELVLSIDNIQRDSVVRLISSFYEQERPTALFSGTRWITPKVLHFLNEQGLQYPKNISFIGVCHNEWTELLSPSLTVIKEDFETMAIAITTKILEEISNKNVPITNRRIRANFMIRKSTQMIGRGPFGEEVVSIDQLTLTEKEIEELIRSHFKVGISFHYGNTAWMRLHENGIRDTLEKYNVKILSVTEAHFNPDLQVTQLEGLRMQKLDAIIAIPSDDVATAAKFKELAKEVTLVFISNIPQGLTGKEYASCVSTNEREGGYEAGILLGEYFKNREKVHVGFIAHGAPFYGTHLRDGTAEQVVRENYPNLNIVSVLHFHTIERAYNVCIEMVTKHPELEALYVSWDGPALQVIKALKELKREDIAIFTFDLDLEIAQYLAKGDMVKGLVTQRPYTQGTAVALATAKALLGGKKYKYIGVSPYVVQKNNLVKAWEDIFHTFPPQKIEKALNH